MKSRLVLLALAFLVSMECFPLAVAQGTRVDGAERAAADLRRGMTPEQVEQLLGKPWRTFLTNHAGDSSPGRLRWTYTWSRSSENLNIDFTSKTAEQWLVSGWYWSGY